MTARVFVGTDGVTEVLVTLWDNGTAEVATRPDDSTWTWSPPTVVRELVSEVPC